MSRRRGSHRSGGYAPDRWSQVEKAYQHREFYRDASEAMLRVQGAGREFMRYFAGRYPFDRMGKAGGIISMAAAHHRFNYHPFPDGNGRVSRLMSHSVAWKADIAAHGLWSISRGLARGLRVEANTSR